MSNISNPVGGGAPDPHAATHQNGGSDEVSVTGLSGLLADAQTPLSHGHVQADVTGLVADLAGKAALLHAAQHQNGGSDPVKLDDLATPDDNTDLDASTLRHGLLQKFPGGTSNFLRADGVFAAPPGGGGGLSFSSAIASLGSFPRTDGNFTIAGAGLTVGKPVLVMDAAGPGGWKDDDKVTARGEVESTTLIRVYWSSGRIGVMGNHTFDYAVGA